MSDQYYTLEEVMKKLEKSRSTVLREAKAGLIPFEIEEGKTKGRLYPKQAIDVLAEIQHQKKKIRRHPALFSQHPHLMTFGQRLSSGGTFTARTILFPTNSYLSGAMSMMKYT